MEEVALEKLDVKKILTKSFSIYRENFGKLIILSFIVTVIYYLFSFFMSKFIEPYMSSIGMNPIIIMLVTIIIALAVIYVSMRVEIGIQLYVKMLLNDEDESLINALKMSRGRVWGVILAYIGLGFLMIVPGTFMAIGRSMLLPIFGKVIFITIGILAAIYVLIKNGLAPIIRAVEPECEACFGHSSNLVKGHTKEMFFIVVIANLGLALNSYLNYMHDLELVTSIARTLTTSLITLFYTPFEACVLLIAFIKLSDLLSRKVANGKLTQV